MRAITVIPKQQGSLRLDDVPEPPAGDGEVLVETIAIGICGTDVEIMNGDYGWAPPGRERLIIGHESLGRVAEAPPESNLHKGRSGRRYRASPRPGAVRELRRWSMGLL